MWETAEIEEKLRLPVYPPCMCVFVVNTSVCVRLCVRIWVLKTLSACVPVPVCPTDSVLGLMASVHHKCQQTQAST